MQSAETVLGIIRERGKKGLPLENLYRQLFNPALYLRAYSRIYRNAGAMTPGASSETVDGMSQVKIETIIAKVRYERYRWQPVRRVYIHKKHSTKLRPLGLPSWSDKLLCEVIRSILEAYYEVQFSDHSHGFRTGRGVHTALREIQHTWKGTNWIIEGDIARCFESLDIKILISILNEKIHDNRFLRLIENLLKTGYLENWKYHQTLSGCPQGSVLSPILANLYLDRLDKFVEQELIPSYTRGVHRRINLTYNRLRGLAKYYKKKGYKKKAQKLRQAYKQLPAYDPLDPEYRRLRYCRYADDFTLGLAGSHQEAENIKLKLKQFLQDKLKLTLSEEKTLITHGRTEAARFLNYEIEVMNSNQYRDKRGQRTINAAIGLKVPAKVVPQKAQAYMSKGRPVHRPSLIINDAFSIVAQYQQEYRGIVEYYQLAYNRHRFIYLKWAMEWSLIKTLANKFKTSGRKIKKRFSTTIQTETGKHKVLQVTVKREGKAALVAQWGGISLARNPEAEINDQPKPIWNGSNELLKRLLADTCELCGSQEKIEVHHIKALKDLNHKGKGQPAEWKRVMSARKRKTLVVCSKCHQDIHAGRQPVNPEKSVHEK